MAIDISRLSLFNKIDIIIHTGEGDSGINHIKYWIPELMKTKREFAVLVRNEKVWKSLIKEFPRLTVLFATSPLDVEAVVTKIPTLKMVLYTSNTGNNIHLLRFNEYKHIFLGTENSDRDSKVTKFMRAYDEIWLSSDAVIDKITKEIECGHLALVKIGKPQLKDIIANKLKRDEKKILVVPSYEGKNESENFSLLGVLPSLIYDVGSLDFGFDFVLDKKIGTRNKKLQRLQDDIKEATESQNIFSSFHSVVEDYLVVKNKYIICDIKTYSNKLLASNNIIFLYIPEDKVIETYTVNKYLDYSFVYPFSDIKELVQMISKIQNGYDEKEEIRNKAIDYWLGVEETLADTFYNLLV